MLLAGADVAAVPHCIPTPSGGKILEKGKSEKLMKIDDEENVASERFEIIMKRT